MRSLFKHLAKSQSWQEARAIATASAGPSIPIIDIGPFLEQTGSRQRSRRQLLLLREPLLLLFVLRM